MISSFLGAFTSGIDEVEEFFRIALWRVEAEWNPGLPGVYGHGSAKIAP
jgi:hypothetical protein